MESGCTGEDDLVPSSGTSGGDKGGLVIFVGNL